MDLKVSYYIHFADHLLKAKGEEVFRRVVQEGVDAYINNWKRKEAAEEKAYELKKQAEKLELWRSFDGFPLEHATHFKRFRNVEGIDGDMFIRIKDVSEFLKEAIKGGGT